MKRLIACALILSQGLISIGQELSLNANGQVVIDCSNMLTDAIAKESKGNAATGILADGCVSFKSATVYRSFQVAEDDCFSYYSSEDGTHAGAAETFDWRTAVGYKSSHTGAYPKDSYAEDPKGNHSGVIFSGGYFSGVNPNAVFMMGAPIVNETTTKYGCNGYWEGSFNDPDTGMGCWRLPNKKELALIWIFVEQLNHIKGMTDFQGSGDYISTGTGHYWSASEREAASGHYSVIKDGTFPNASKTNLKRARCIREVESNY